MEQKYEELQKKYDELKAKYDEMRTQIYESKYDRNSVYDFINANHKNWQKDSSNILVNGGDWFKSNFFYEDYKLWCQENNIKPSSEMFFVKKFIKICYTKKTNHGNFVCLPLIFLHLTQKQLKNK